MPILDFNKMKVQSKWDQFKNDARWWIHDKVEWAKNNPELAAMFVTGGLTIFGGLCKLGKGLVRTCNLNKERYNKERYIYDHSLGMYLHTKRPLNNKDYITINNRRKNGERLSDILESMRILD